MALRPDPTFYPSPKMAMQAQPERLAYIALLNVVKNGKRDALTRYTTPLTGAYYFVPSTESLRDLAPAVDEPAAAAAIGSMPARRAASSSSRP